MHISWGKYLALLEVTEIFLEMFAALLGMTVWLRLLARQMSMCEDGTSYSGGRNIHPGEKRANRESPRSQTDSADSLPLSLFRL